MDGARSQDLTFAYAADRNLTSDAVENRNRGGHVILSIFLGHLHAAMLWIANELLAFRIDYKIEYFERHLANQIGDILRDFHDLKGAAAAEEFETHFAVLVSFHAAIRGPRENLAGPFQSEPFNHARF